MAQRHHLALTVQLEHTQQSQMPPTRLLVTAVYLELFQMQGPLYVIIVQLATLQLLVSRVALAA